ncbi:MAG: hypothetical protein KH846_05185 [Leptotrichia wadei]|jgi:hypothetical protein|uniref:hypothetical protein n=1 Tax=Leptotrichia wadei TaxID=157687 RepID=UPI0026EEAF04|nr:hypothetical protein [Leptotrichia wadei]MBS6019576.1 hypothetical protein [Leptotrichia wadei]
MPAQKKTSLGLNQWIGSEYPKRIDFVEDNKIIDDELIKRVKYTDVATETKEGIARIHSLDTVENQSNELQNMVTKNLQSQISDFIKTLNNDEILTAKSLVKYLSKLLKPATENTFGLIDYQTIKQVAPKPDLTPYVPFSKGYRVKDNTTEFVRSNGVDLWSARFHYMYDEAGNYMGAYHLNGGRAYYKVPNRNGGGWNEIMDNHDMAARDNRMNNMDADRNNVRNLAQDAWNKANDAQLNRVANMRLAGYINAVIRGADQGNERVGYVVTGVNNFNTDSVPDSIHMRCLQFQFGHGGWVTVWG